MLLCPACWQALNHDLQFFLPSLPPPPPSPGASRLPPSVVETLEVFVLSPKELAELLEAADQGEGGWGYSSMGLHAASRGRE